MTVNSFSGHFMYTEASTGRRGDVAHLATGLISNDNICLRFYCHMHGNDIDTLSVLLSPQDHSQSNKTIWTKKGKLSAKTIFYVEVRYVIKSF